MVDIALGCLLGITMASAFWLVARARGSSRRASRATTPESQLASLDPTLQELRRRLSTVEADQVDLSSSQEKLHTTVKRLTSRAGMQELRERRSHSSPPPVGTSKADLLRHYGMSGKIGPAFAQAQLELERDTQRTN